MAHACGHCGNQHEASVTVCPVTGGRLGTAAYTFVNEDDVLVGSIVAERYHVREVLGQGSTGTVFGIEHLNFGRNATMKVVRPRYTTLDAVLRVFERDTRGALGISHPSLCEVFDIGTLPDGSPFFVMERLQGDTLASRLGRERFSAATAVDFMMQLLSAMDAVHEHGLLLRDLRPQNVFLAQRRGCRPVVKLLDIGLARIIPIEKIEAEWDRLRATTMASDVTGLLSIPYYLSPERSRGEAGLEPASDIFVAAIILYEALTGQKPFTAKSWNGLVQQIATAEPPRLRVIRPDLPVALETLLTRALSANPQARPPSARELQNELRAVFDGSRRRGNAHADGGDEQETAPPPPQQPPAALRAGATDQPDEEEATRANRKRSEILGHLRSVDEASADHPGRTDRPPQPIPAAGGSVAVPPSELEIDVDVDVDIDMPEPTLDLAIPLSWKERATESEEEETATMELTPELRDRIEQMTKPHPNPEGPAPSREEPRPPTTRRIRRPRS